MAMVIDEKQTGDYRLLIIDNKEKFIDRKTVLINNKSFEKCYLHGLSNALAIKCTDAEPSMIGSKVT